MGIETKDPAREACASAKPSPDIGTSDYSSVIGARAVTLSCGCRE